MRPWPLLAAELLKLNRYDSASWIQLGLLYEAGNESTLGPKTPCCAAAAVVRYHFSAQLVAGELLFPARKAMFLAFGTGLQKAGTNGSRRRHRPIPASLVCQSKCSGNRSIGYT